MGGLYTSLRKNLWDEENRLRGVDLNPDDEDDHPIAVYTYDAGGARIVRYNLDRKRISAKTGTVEDMGLFPASLVSGQIPALTDHEFVRGPSDQSRLDAEAVVEDVHFAFEQSEPQFSGFREDFKIRYDHTLQLNTFYFHKDHLGSSSYITNDVGNVTQHMEYLPFGETLVDEHTNSFNSPFKYNGKELDEETGNYYYGARYYDPKWSIWLSVDPLAEKYPGWSSYNYCLNNPINTIDFEGLYPIIIVTRSYAPFPTFGPSNSWHGDGRGHSLDVDASFRCSTFIFHDTESRITDAMGLRSRSYTVDGKKDAISPTLVDNRTKKGSNFIDVHSAGTNKAQFGAQPIDQFTKLMVSTEGNIKNDHILSITGTISGDDFPNQESMIYDSTGNGLWLGNFETPGDRQSGPVTDLIFENEDDVNMNINIRIKVNKESVFQGVMQKGKDGKETMISIDQWNKTFKSDDNK